MSLEIINKTIGELKQFMQHEHDNSSIHQFRDKICNLIADYPEHVKILQNLKVSKVLSKALNILNYVREEEENKISKELLKAEMARVRNERAIIAAQKRKIKERIRKREQEKNDKS